MERSRRMRDGGGINLVKLSMIAAVVAIGYFSFIYVPVILDQFGMKKAVRVGCNIAYTQRSADAVKRSIMNSFKELNMRDQYIDQNTLKTAVTPTNFSEDDIQVDFVNSPPQVTVSIAYQRRVVWPLLDKEKTIDYSYTHTESLETVSIHI